MMLGQALKRLVLKYTAHTRLHPHYPFKLVKQNGDLTLELQPDSGDVPGFSNIPLRVGAPGTVMKLQPGTRAVLVFENGDRKAPVAIPLFDKDAGALLEHELHAQTKASLVAPDVRLGDTGATEPLVLGNLNASLEESYDSECEAAYAALAAALATATTALAALLPAAPHSPALADGQQAAVALAPVLAAMTALTTALSAASASRTAGRGPTLSGTSKTI